jgi:hypothetical protein
LRTGGSGSALNLARQLPKAFSGIPCVSQYSRLIELAFYPGLMMRAPKSLAVSLANWRHLVLHLKIYRREQIASEPRMQEMDAYRQSVIRDLNSLIPAKNYPVLRNIFPVNLRRELREK